MPGIGKGHEMEVELRGERRRSAPESVRWLLPLSWALASAGYWGPWVAHRTAALSVSGANMAEFVKFLPAAEPRWMGPERLVFYLPAFAIVVSIALLVGSRQLRYPRGLRAVALVLALAISLQLLPPAWSPASLLSAEFRAQTAAVAGCWLLLGGFPLWGRLPTLASGLLVALAGLISAALPAMQLRPAMSATAGVYGAAVPIGWGYWLCTAGLVAIAALGLGAAVWRRTA